MPDEEEAGSPEEEPTPAPEAVPSPKQEQEEPAAEAEEPSDSGAQEPEDEAPEPSRLEQAKALIATIAGDDPELAAALTEEYGVKVEDVDGELAKLKQENSQLKGQTAGQAAYQAIAKSRDDFRAGIDDSVKKYVGDLSERVGKAASDVGIDDPKLIDAAKLIPEMGVAVTQAEAVGRDYSGSVMRQLVADVIQTHPAAASFTEKDLAAFTPPASSDGRPLSHEAFVMHFVKVAMDLSMRAAPEGVRKQIRDDVEKEMGAAEAFTKLSELVGPKNGNVPTDVSRKGQAVGKKRTNDEIKMDPNTPPEELIKIRAAERKAG